MDVNNLNGISKTEGRLSRSYKRYISAGTTSPLAWNGIYQRGLDEGTMFPVEEAVS